MATRTVSNAGGNWNATTTWVGGVVPLQNDDVVFTATSGNLVVNVSTQRLLSINFTNYVNTITFNNVINVLGTINLGTGGYTQAGSSGFSINGTSTLISNGVIWSRTILFTSGLAATFTLSDTWNVTGNITMSLSAAFTFNGNTLNIGGSLSVSNTNIASGTTVFVFNGTGTWSHSSTGVIRNNVTINTTGTLTISGNIYYNTGTLTYTSGTVITTGSTLTIAASTTLDTDRGATKITWNNITCSTLNLTLILTTDLTCQNFFQSSGGTNFSGVGRTFFINGDLTHASGSDFSGSATIQLSGTGIVTTSSTGSFINTIVINTTGTITFSGTIRIKGGSITYIPTGTVITTGSTLAVTTSTTFDTSGITWDNFTISGVSYSITLLSNLNITGLTTFSNTGSVTFSTGGNLFNPTGDMSITNGARTLPNDIYIKNLTLNGNNNPTITANKLYVLGNLTVDGTNSIVGTTEIILSGTGTWSNSSNAELRNNLTIDTNGIITLGTNVYYAVGTFKYIKGKVITKNSTFNNINTGATLINCHKINFDRVIIGTGNTITMNEFFCGSPSLKTKITTLGLNNIIINFQDNFEKIAKFVEISKTTISRRNQLLVITDSKKSSSNVGIRYINQSPNGIPKGDPSIQNILTPGISTFLVGDPAMSIK